MTEGRSNEEKDSGVLSFDKMPGPWGLPILGSLLTLGSAHPRRFSEWGSKYYGNIFRYKMVYQDYVVLNGYEAVEDGLLLCGNSLSGRKPFPVVDHVHKGKRIFFTNCDSTWREWKTFAIRAMAAAMPGMPLKICDEGEKLISDMLGLGFATGTAIDIKDLMKCRMAQIGFRSFIDKEFEETEVQGIIDEIYGPFRSKPLSGLLFLIPSLAYIPPFNRYLDAIKRNYTLVQRRLEKAIKERLSPDDDSTDVAASFFKDHPNPDEDEIERLACLLIDWIFAGVSTTSEQALWVLLFLMKHPDQMKIVQAELSNALKDGKGVEQLYNNKDLVPRFQASIHEAMRLRPIAPMAFFHKTIDEAVVGGFRIPENVVIVPNVWSAHHDPDLWSPDPESFRPERHISGDGKFLPSKNVIPFSLGPRKCVGEELARANIFIINALLLSRYDFQLAQESENVDMEGELASILQTPDFKIQIHDKLD